MDYQLQVTINFNFEGKINPQHLQELFEAAALLAPAFAEKEAMFHSFDDEAEMWRANGEEAKKVLFQIAQDIHNSM
jgi:hypothetical protein